MHEYLCTHTVCLQVFLQHLTPLLSLSTFTALWLTILDFMDKYMHADKSDLLVSEPVALSCCRQQVVYWTNYGFFVW